MKTHLVFAIFTAALLVFAISRTDKPTVSFETVVAIAERLASEPWVPRPALKSPTLESLDYDQIRNIRWRDQFSLWRKEALPFQVKFFHTGGLHPDPVSIFHVGKKGAGPVRFSPEFFDYGENRIPERDRKKGDYAGFRVHYPINTRDVLDEICVFLGASYFRAVPKGLKYGLSARGLAIDTLDDEEFPAFTSFWLHRPARGADELTIHALLDGPTVTGAYAFTIRPGTTTAMDVRAVLFFRGKPKRLGLAPLTSMFWYGENTSNTFGNFRPEVHDSDGLLIHTSAGEWIWRPLAWSPNVQENVFRATGCRGFGLLQRDRDFQHYQDLEAHYHERPSAWIIPHGHWADGSIHLVQLPTTNEYMDNIVAFWMPDELPKPGSRLEFGYTIHWYGEAPDRPALARCISTRMDFQEAPYYRMMVLDFAGGGIESLPSESRPDANITVSAPATLSQIQVQRNDYNQSWRVSFVASANDLSQPIEMACRLETEGNPLSETWTYTWKP